ncbi:MAG: DUF116 domain-containing protein [Candidatus Hydrothermarchaeales archaeon]
MFYETLGKISFAIILSLILLFLISTILGILLIKRHRVILPKVLLFTIDTFYLQVKRLAKMFGVGGKIVDQIGIEVRNNIYEDDFSKIEVKDRILVVPQCLRHIKCPARLDSNVGVTCKECGMCVLKEVKHESERLGYRFFIVPGGTFVERIVRAVKPRAALGIACHRDLNMAMHALSNEKCVVQGLPLTKDGCVQTEVDLKRLFEKMKLGIEEITPELNIPSCPSEEDSKSSRS